MAPAKYDVLSQTIEMLLSAGTTQFRVPDFQRPYSWTAAEISQLTDDLFGEGGSERPYFLGSVVLARQESSQDAPDLILDGQQRLTTISLMISALIHKMKEHGSEEADEQKSYLFHRRVKGRRDPKILPQQDDRVLYEKLLNEPLSFQQDADSPLSKAMKTLLVELSRHSNESFGGEPKPFESMLERLLYEVEIVRITAPSERDAFRLFETLNDRGLALSAADLIKNKLFAQSKALIHDTREAWEKVLSYTRDDDAVSFLRTYWMAVRAFIRKRGLYDTFKTHIEEQTPHEALQFARDIERHAKIFAEISGAAPESCQWGPQVGATLQRLSKSYGVRNCRPLLLSIASMFPSDLPVAVRLCESVTIRYSVVGDKNPNHLERMYAEMCCLVRSGNDYWHEFKKIFNSIPDDSEFHAKLCQVRLQSHVPKQWRELLIQLNSEISDGELRIGDSNLVHVEHILPRSPSQAALAESGMNAAQAEECCYRLGNLTLLGRNRNQRASNLPFSKKRALFESSDIALTRRLATYRIWSQEAIESRTQELASLAVKRFPHPADICLSRPRESSN
jgi:hypothetical protein